MAYIKKITKEESAVLPEKLQQKYYKFMLWAQRILRHRGLRIDLNSCSVGQVVKVGKVMSLGQGCVFQPQACYGCYISQFTREQTCWLQKSWLPCPIKVKTDDTIFLPSVTQILEGIPILKLDANKVFHSSLYF